MTLLSQLSVAAVALSAAPRRIFIGRLSRRRRRRRRRRRGFDRGSSVRHLYVICVSSVTDTVTARRLPRPHAEVH